MPIEDMMPVIVVIFLLLAFMLLLALHHVYHARLNKETLAAVQRDMQRIYGCKRAAKVGPAYRCTACALPISPGDCGVQVEYQGGQLLFHEQCFVKWHIKHFGNKCSCCGVAVKLARCDEENSEETRL